MGQTLSLPVLISPTGVQAVHPEGEVAVARAAAARGTAMGLSSFASKPVEDDRRGQPPDVLPDLLGGFTRPDPARADRARSAGAAGADRHARLDLLARARLGQPADPRAARLQDDAALRARGAEPPALAISLGQNGRPTRSDRPEHGRAGRRRRQHSSVHTASGCRRGRPGGTTCGGCASNGMGRSCSRA